MKILPKIDIHVHTGLKPTLRFRRDGSTYASPDELRHIYDTINVERALLLPSVPEISLREAIGIVRDWPNVFGWWFCDFDPMGGNNEADRDMTVEIRRYKDLGAKGIGESCWNYYFDDPCMLNLFKYAEQLDMPITFHIGNKGHDYGIVDDFGLPRLEKVLQMFPKLKFLGHSQKFWAEISGDLDPNRRGGYPTGPVTPGGRLPELLRKYPNLCCDLSAGSGCNAITRDPAFGWAFLEEFQDRCYYGTDICDPRNIDSPMLKLAGFLDDAMLNGKISYAAYEKISRGNALDLLER